MQLIDTHAHLDEEAFRPDLAEVLARARAAGVARIVTIGTTLASSRAAVELAGEHPMLAAAVGIQPNYVAQAAAGDWEAIERLAHSPHVVAIGETGLDRYWDHAPFDLQEEYFVRHIDLARRLGLPFVVHCREAEADVVAALRRETGRGELRGVMHSFTGGIETATACIELGLMISLAGMVTFKKNDALRELARQVPLDRLLVETDAPYLAPTPYRGKRNEPAYVRQTAECLAAARGIDLDQLAAATTANARRLFFSRENSAA